MIRPTCEIKDCCRNFDGNCTLSKLNKEEYAYRLPSNCSHRLWKLDKNKRKKK